MSKIKEIGKELMGKSLNSYHRKTGLSQLEKNNEMQDGILNGILSQVNDAYIEKTEQSNIIHLEGSGDGVVILDSIEGNTMVDLEKGILQSSFEEHRTDEGQYKIEILSRNSDSTKSNKLKLLLNEPLRSVGNVKDKLLSKDDVLVVERNCGIREYQEGDIDASNILTDTINSVYQLEEPIYEEVLNEYGVPVLLEGYENGTLYIDSIITPTITVKYTPKMESFKAIQEVSVCNDILTEDINEAILPYLMEIDFMITEKELALTNARNIIRKMEVVDMTNMQKRTGEMLERLIKGKTLTEQECLTRITTYLRAAKITDSQAEELMLLIDEVYA